MRKCLKCNSGVKIYGSECYPEEGISVECDNLDCDYEIVIQTSLRTNKLKEMVRLVHETIQEV